MGLTFRQYSGLKNDCKPTLDGVVGPETSRLGTARVVGVSNRTTDVFGIS